MTKCQWVCQGLFYSLQPTLFLVTHFSSSMTIQSQIIRKLNPMKSPRQPPQSATRDGKENAFSSFLTMTESLENTGHSSVLALVITHGFCSNCIINHHRNVQMFYLPPLYSINVQGIKHFVSWRISFLTMLPILSYSLAYLFKSVELSHKGSSSTVNLRHGGWHPTFLIIFSSTHWPKL